MERLVASSIIQEVKQGGYIMQQTAQVKYKHTPEGEIRLTNVSSYDPTTRGLPVPDGIREGVVLTPSQLVDSFVNPGWLIARPEYDTSGDFEKTIEFAREVIE
jgi:hypothetical protein